VDERGPKAVVLDLFDTLVKWSPQRLPQMEIRGKRVHTTIPWLVPDLERGLGAAFQLERFIETYTAVLHEIDAERSARGVEITCHERFRRTVERLDGAAQEPDALAEQLTRRHMAAVRSVTAAPPEYAAVVPRLARRFRMGILSNFDDARTGREIIADTGTEHYFEVIIISAETGVRKPHPEIFRQLLDKLALTPREVLFVGDTAREDVAGARACGIPVVWLSENKGEFPAEVAAPDYALRNLTELPSLLGVE
jgi:HAD superfamily hydrolase (TIGR01549 family)